MRYDKTAEQNKALAILFLLAFLSATIYFFFLWPTMNPVGTTSAAHYYEAQQIYQARALYRDVASDKPPLTEYVSAVCFFIHRGKTVPAIILTRFVFFSFMLFSSVNLFILARHLWDNRTASNTLNIRDTGISKRL